jgi:hypothetical protein
MTIEKQTSVDKIESLPSGIVQVRTKTTITEAGKEIGSAFHRHVVAPGDDYSKEDARVQAICKVTHTPEVIAAYKAAQVAIAA